MPTNLLQVSLGFEWPRARGYTQGFMGTQKILFPSAKAAGGGGVPPTTPLGLEGGGSGQAPPLLAFPEKPWLH